MIPRVNPRPDTARALELGRALYNARRFWEAHEAWEAAWIEEDGEIRQLLQGLIQVAAGYFKGAVHRRPSGAVKLLASGLAKLEPLPDDVCGLALGPFRTAVAASLVEARRWASGERAGFEADVAPPLLLAPAAGGEPPPGGGRT